MRVPSRRAARWRRGGQARAFGLYYWGDQAMKRIFVFALATILMIAADSARAINCTWDTVPSNINFGTYFPLTSGKITANSGFQFTCTPPAIATLKLSRGAAPTYNRYMP